ncbi:TonB-dependent receptor, partial [uncultured Sphingomonas sp.]|uniref:TonB-dependent receptor n=1 Tax=uncultured Sphingomonas sp. TaxID=158754 RepID=UPI0035CBC64E
IVTAQKRDQSLQDVPLSIVAVTPEILVEQRVETVSDLQRIVPGLTAQRGASVSNLRLNIRGIGAAGNTSVDQSVAVFLDGVYVARPSAVYSSFLDVAGVEVVRGPQGTLFGRNTTAGGIILRTTDPQREAQALGYAEYGAFDRYRAEAVLNPPGNDRFRLRLALQTAGTDGYGRNLLDGSRFGRQRSMTGRLGLASDITDTLSWTGKIDYAGLNGDGQTPTEAIGRTIGATQRAALAARLGGAQFLPELDDATDRRVFQITTGRVDDRQVGASSRLVWNVDGWEARLIGGWRDYKNDQFDGEITFLPKPLASRNSSLYSESRSQELQLVSPSDRLLGGKLDLVAGLYYFGETLDITERLNLDPNFCSTFAAGNTALACLRGPLAGATALTFRQESDSYAAYGQLDYELVPTITVQLGARYTWDRKNGVFVQRTANPVATALRAPENDALRFRDDRPTYRAALTWEPLSTLNLFASYSTGYKAGGFNSGGGTPALGVTRRTFASETARNYELGLRSQFADRRITLNVTGYRVDLDDFQDRSFDGTTFLIRNAGRLRHQGVEAEARIVVTPAFRLNGALAYLDSEFRSFIGASAFPGCSAASPAIPQCGPVGGVRTVRDLTGGRAHYAPDWQGSLTALYDVSFGNDWKATISGGATHVGDQFVGSVTDNNPATLQKAYTLLNARVAITPPGGRLELAAFGENLTDKGYCANILYQPSDALLGVRNPQTGDTLARCFVGAPRTYGVSARLRF